MKYFQRLYSKSAPFGTSQTVVRKESRRAVQSTARWCRTMRSVLFPKERNKPSIYRRLKDRRGTEYIQLSTGQIMRRFA